MKVLEKRTPGKGGQPPARGTVKYNLNGQKLGRKGRDTRDRILAATVELLEAGQNEPVSLSAVARRASLGMTAIYNYFSDLTELLLAVLEPVMATAEETYLSVLRQHWSDDELSQHCVEFVRGYHTFWSRHSRLLHLRNSMADRHDERMIMHRVQATQPVIRLLVSQMGGDPDNVNAPAAAMATVVMTGIERSVTIATDRQLPELMGWDFSLNFDRYLGPGARLLELAIRDIRGSLATSG